MKATSRGQITVSDCLVRANVCAFRGNHKTVLSVNGTCRNLDRENKHGQTVVRKQDEWLFSVIEKHSGECPK